MLKQNLFNQMELQYHMLLALSIILCFRFTLISNLSRAEEGGREAEERRQATAATA